LLPIPGRISISTGVVAKDVREQEVPTGVAPERFQTHQSFIARTAPELAGALEAALILPAGGFHRAAALRFAGPPRRGIVHPPTMAFQLRHFSLHRLPFLLAQSFGQRAQIV
jgi:hypothetical protein